MKFGEHLQTQQVEEWKSYYLDYEKLKKMIQQLSDSFVSKAMNTGEKGTAIQMHITPHQLDL